MSRPNSKAYLYTFLVILFWSTIASAFKIALRYQSPDSLLFVSSLFSLLIFLTVLAVRGRLGHLFRISPRQLGKSVILGFLNPFLYYLILLHAYNLLPAQQAQPLNMTWGIVIAVLSVPLLKQKLKLRDLAALVITYTGVLVIAFGGRLTSLRFQNTLGVVLALSTAFIWALYWIANTRDNLPALERLFYNFAAGWVFILIYRLIFHSLTLPSLPGLLAGLYVGIFEFGITYILWLLALRIIDRTVKITVLIYIVPFLSFVFISLFVGEHILPSSVLGAILISGGILFQKMDEIRRRRV